MARKTVLTGISLCGSLAKDLDAAVEEHLDELEKVTDIGRAHEACSNHAEAMQSRFDRMEEVLDHAGCM